ncbi:MAG TPA: VWA domain-containing protein [Vicinamibacterales bacterium]|nr:VWA domain-containing protein [Vicinamibacterales bacterium]
MRRGLALLLLLLVSIAGSAGSAQRFRSGVDVVRVDALVTEGGRAVTGLKVEDFQLRDNGVLQEIDSVAVDEAPISMLLVLDTSNSVEGPTLDHLKQAAIAAVDALSPNDRAAVMTFADAVTLRADWSAATAATRTAIAAARAGGSTSLYDASYAALTLQDSLPGRRSYVLLFSDGGDTASWLPASAALERARRSDAVVYVVTRRAPRPDVRLEYRAGIELWTQPSRPASDRPAMVELAAATGGHVFVVQRADELRAAFAAVVSQFRSRYLLTYRPRGVESAGWHAVDVTLTSSRATVTARRGYAK